MSHDSLFLEQKKMDKETALETLPLLLFQIENSTFAMNFNEIREVAEFYYFTDYPLEIPGHLGIVNLRGNLIPIIDPFCCQRKSRSTFECVKNLKYLIFQTQDKNLAGLIASQIRKVEVEKAIISNDFDEQLISIDNSPVRYITSKYIMERNKSKESAA
jgi:chemotaxis signal transduction protein